MADTELDLNAVRQRIDDIDQHIQRLIVERAVIVETVGNIKKKQSEEPIFYRPEREAQVLRNIMERDCGPLSKKDMANIFRTIMSSCLALQSPMSIAYLGPEGTFSQAAVIKHFGNSVVPYAAKSITDVFAKVVAKEVNYGVVPIENSIGGIVNATIDAFIDSDLQICGEVSLEINQNLLINPKITPQVHRIYSHEQSLLQCRHWLKKHYATAEQIAVRSNAYAAQLAASEEKSAAIAGDMAAEIYGLEKIASHIQDVSNNITRFLIIGHVSPPPSGSDRTSLMVSVSNSPGALENLITPFAKHQINLTLINSRPAVSQKNQYVFFLDIDGHYQEEHFAKVLSELKQQNFMVKLLGSYPQAVL